jgi:four helix bundle protein
MSQIEIALDLGYVNEEQYNDIETQVTDISKMLSGLRQSYIRKL